MTRKQTVTGARQASSCFQKSGHDGSCGWVKLYRATYQERRQCPLKPTCITKGTYKQLPPSIYGGPYHQAWQSRRGQRMRQVRQSTVKPVFGNLIHYHGLGRMNVRGQAGAHKAMLLTAVSYDLKKLLNHRPTRQGSAMGSCQGHCWPHRGTVSDETAVPPAALSAWIPHFLVRAVA